VWELLWHFHFLSSHRSIHRRGGVAVARFRDNYLKPFFFFFGYACAIVTSLHIVVAFFSFGFYYGEGIELQSCSF
jgi:hypothetical protein